MGQEPGPIVNHVISAITIEEFHHEHFPMVSAYRGLSPMQAELLDLVPDRLNVSNRSSTEPLDPESDSEYSENDAEAPRESSKNNNSLVITSPPLDATLDVSVCTATSPHFPFTFPITTSGPVSSGTPSELFTPIWSANPISTHTFSGEYSPTDAIVEKLQNSRTPISNFAPEDECIYAITLNDRLNALNDLSAPGSPTITSSDLPDCPEPITDSALGSFSPAVSRPAELCSDFSPTALETSSSTVYVNPVRSPNTHIYPFAVDQGNGAMILDTYEITNLVADGIVSMNNDEPDNMSADQEVDMLSDENANISKIDNLMIDPANIDASIVSAAVIFPQDDSPRPQKGKGVDELIVEEQALCIEEQAPSFHNSAASIDKQESNVENPDLSVDKRACNFDRGASMGPVAALRRSTIRLKKLGRKLLKPDLQEQQHLVAVSAWYLIQNFQLLTTHYRSRMSRIANRSR